jgi:hypothetical protein
MSKMGVKICQNLTPKSDSKNDAKISVIKSIIFLKIHYPIDQQILIYHYPICQHKIIKH